MIRKHVTFFVVVITIIYFNGFFNGYRIININSIIKNKIEQSLTDNSFDIENVIIREKVNVDNKLIIFFTFNEEGSGWLEFERGYNLSYKESRQVFGFYNKDINSDIILTNKGPYILIFGKNTENYHIIKYEVEDLLYQDVLPNSEYFLIYHKLPEFTDPKCIAKNIKLS